MRVRFSRSYDHRHEPAVVQNFPEGFEGTVPAEIGRAAISAGAAREIETSKPSRASRTAEEPASDDNETPAA